MASGRGARSGPMAVGSTGCLSAGGLRSSPLLTGEPVWETPETRELMVSATCGCHSDDAASPSRADIAPIAWSMASCLPKGRSEVYCLGCAATKRGFAETINVVNDRDHDHDEDVDKHED